MGPVFKSLFLGWPELGKTMLPPPSPELEKSVRLAGSAGMSATRFIFVTGAGAQVTTRPEKFYAASALLPKIKGSVKKEVIYDLTGFGGAWHNVVSLRIWTQKNFHCMVANAFAFFLLIHNTNDN
jgi:hypothetical protein